jgi:hypothetical protein
MKINHVAAGLAFLLSLGLQNTRANDSGERGDRSDTQQRRDHRSEQRQQDRITVERRAETEPRRPTVDRMVEQNRHPNHLSAEERRALRQQINEAGQDIYNRQR